MIEFYHTPVLLSEVFSGVNVVQGCWYVDCTLGGGGYSVELLKRGGNVIGIDTDSDAIAYARKRFATELPEKKEGVNWITVNENFRNLADIVTRCGVETISGIVFDLGVSSAQLDKAERGFSFRYPDAPLDMRMNNTDGILASSILNTYSEEALYDIFARFGEEERAGTVAHAVTVARKVKLYTTIKDLLDTLEVVRLNNDRSKSRIFQALRIEVNQEFVSLKEALEGAETILSKGSSMAIVSFHSLEDRIVKQFFLRDSWNSDNRCITATRAEIMRNPRSRSAKLRVGVRI